MPTSVNVRWVPNPDFERQLLSQSSLIPVMGEYAEDVEDIAYDLVPVDEGDLRDSIDSWAGYDNGRVIGRVFATHYTAWWIEHGWSTHPGGFPFLVPAAAEVIGNVE
jgi:hypothetical protein